MAGTDGGSVPVDVWDQFKRDVAAGGLRYALQQVENTRWRQEIGNTLIETARVSEQDFLAREEHDREEARRQSQLLSSCLFRRRSSPRFVG